ncbi:hypothetical protein ACFP1I_31010 [Dyadobacter subterraneus]|uniref:DUF1700 domain-containing protein n=1 Tax=Dyadobacter subterraneus TaxID=2773304 RepID=A0ABR9W8L4_9BACT|nr:hypothetical protein [Dyadobacter subterraneus]MBE9461748.1 hypothetical protein [Dyadobacter subterraneus]
MEEDKEEIFKKLIQKSEPDFTASDFTDHVMKMVQAEELVRESALHALLVNNKLDQPSLSFESGIMAQITPVKKKVEKPIISKNAWYIAATFFALMIQYSFFSKSSQITAMDSSLIKITNAMFDFSNNAGQMPVIYFIVVVTLCVLLLADYFILQRFGKRAVH